MSDTGSTDEGRSGSALARSGRLGRRVGIALFWLMATYVVGMSALSIIPSLYFPGLAPLPPSRETTRCAAVLATLERELTAHTTHHFALRSPPPLGTWLSDWDRHFAELPPHCGALEATRAQLWRARTDLERTLRRYDSEQAAVRRRVRRALDAIPPH